MGNNTTTINADIPKWLHSAIAYEKLLRSNTNAPKNQEQLILEALEKAYGKHRKTVENLYLQK